jgi:hypothetical protein
LTISPCIRISDLIQLVAQHLAQALPDLLDGIAQLATDPRLPCFGIRTIALGIRRRSDK